MALLRLVVDLEVPGETNRQQAEVFRKGVEDYASSVLAPTTIAMGVKETNPGSTFHVHKGTGPCRDCIRLSEDGKQ